MYLSFCSLLISIMFVADYNSACNRYRKNKEIIKKSRSTISVCELMIEVYDATVKINNNHLSNTLSKLEECSTTEQIEELSKSISFFRDEIYKDVKNRHAAYKKMEKHKEILKSFGELD